MIPIYDDPFYVAPDSRIDEAKQEIRAFIECNAPFASVKFFDNYAITTNRKIYVKAVLLLGLSNQIVVRQRQGKILLQKLQ